MPQKRSANTREALIRTGIELFRRHGFSATSVDDICKEAHVTKGAFFHHFESKEALAEECLRQWDQQACVLDAAAPFQSISDPLEKLLAGMDYYIELLGDPQMLKSCLAGTTVHETAESNPKLRAAANLCILNQELRIKARLDDACRSRGKRLDTASLAVLWIATIQGALVLFKASNDGAVVAQSAKHVREYIRSLFESGS
jgi:TetR/AcrR family transcriptional repressor of nem operon